MAEKTFLAIIQSEKQLTDTVQKVLAYAQWVAYNVINKSTISLYLNNGSLSYGKWYQYDDKDKEIPFPSNHEIKPGQSFIVASCGRSNSPSGTTGSFDITLDSAGKQVLSTNNWDCPWGSKTNTWSYNNNYEGAYVIQETGGSHDSGAIGMISVTIVSFSR